MNMFSGKKALCFIALPHHNRFLVPIMEALMQRGMEVVYFTAAAEGAFEITLNQAKLAYRHILDYANAETRAAVAAGMAKLRPLLQEKILTNRAFQSIPLVIHDKVVRSAVENFHCLDQMLRIERPDLLFALHELNPWGKILGYLSHVHKIPYFTLQEGLYYADTHYYRFHTDYSTACVVWGEECREVLLRAGCSDDKIYPLGNTHIWQAKRECTRADAVARTTSELGIDSRKKIVLFLMSHSHYRPFEAAPFLRWMRERGDIALVFKWHPATGKEIIDRALENLKDNPSVVTASTLDTYALIGASVVCVTVGNSTTGLESLAFGKPLIEVRLPDQPYSYALQGVAEQAFGFEDIGKKIESLLCRGASPEMTVAVQRYLDHNFSRQDEAAMPHIVDLVAESLAARNTGPLEPIRSPERIAVPCSIVLPVDDTAPETLLPTLAAISAHTAPELYEVVIVKCGVRPETDALLASLGGDVKIVTGTAGWSYGDASNAAVRQAQGKYVLFLKPGHVAEPGWLEGLLEVAEQDPEVGVVGGQVLNKNGLLWQVGVAFDVNQSPFPMYRFLPREFSGAMRQREFKAVEVPLLLPRELFCSLGGFNPALRNRFDDVDLCLAVGHKGRKIVYTPRSVINHVCDSWQPDPGHDLSNRIRFYSKWTGSLWQNDQEHLRQDGLSHDSLSALYRELAARVAFGAMQVQSSDTSQPNVNGN